jgi:polyhydroxyalkanoate synthesis regulator phasin
MYKAKICSFALACMIGLGSLSPMYAYASETNTESVTLSENDKSQKDKKAAFDEAMKKATDTWNKLTDKQKAEVYSLIENEMKSEIKLMDKLVELGMINKEDAMTFKARMMERFKKLKESGEFPLTRQKGTKKQ